MNHEPTLEEQLEAKKKQDRREFEHHHEQHARSHGGQMLGHLEAIGSKKLLALSTVNGKHYRLRIDVLTDRRAKRLQQKIQRKGGGIK